MFKAPDGTAIAGEAQNDTAIHKIRWPTTSLDPFLFIYEPGAPAADWQTTAYDGHVVFVDEDGEEWFGDHLIQHSAPALSALACGAAMSEVQARRLVHLLEQVRDTCGKGSPLWNLADEQAQWQRLAADGHRETFNAEVLRLRDPDPDQWPGGDITGHPDWKPEEPDLPADGAGETNLGTMRLVDIPNPWDISQHRQDLMTIAAEAMLLEQTVDAVPVFYQAEIKMVLERVAKLFCTITLALQKEAVARDLADRETAHAEQRP